MLSQLTFIASLSHYVVLRSAPQQIFVKAVPAMSRSRRHPPLLGSREHKSSTNPFSEDVLDYTFNNSDEDCDAKIPIIDFGPLQKAVIVGRPSASIKSPYIADIITLADGEDPPQLEDSTFETASSHGGRQALDTARSDFLRRVASKTHLAHAPALDCAGMVVPGAIVYCTANDPLRQVNEARMKLRNRNSA